MFCYVRFCYAITLSRTALLFLIQEHIYTFLTLKYMIVFLDKLYIGVIAVPPLTVQSFCDGGVVALLQCLALVQNDAYQIKLAETFPRLIAIVIHVHCEWILERLSVLLVIFTLLLEPSQVNDQVMWHFKKLLLYLCTCLLLASQT